MNKIIGTIAVLALVVSSFAVYAFETAKPVVVSPPFGAVSTLGVSPLAFNGITIIGLGYNVGVVGSGLRQFWTFQ